MSLKDRIRRDATRVFLREDAFAERIVYYPRGDETMGVSILAVINRSPPKPVDAQGKRDVAYSITIKVANDAQQGIDARTWSQQSDKVGIPADAPGGGIEIRQFAKSRGPLSVDEGMVTLGIV